MFVWRLEDKNGKGVFHGGTFWQMPDSIRFGKGETNYNPSRHPCPLDENLNLIKKVHYCGFKSIKQYKKWFSTKAQRNWLTEQGISLNKYQVEKSFVQSGRFQVIFEKGKAVLIEKREPNFED